MGNVITSRSRGRPVGGSSRHRPAAIAAMMRACRVSRSAMMPVTRRHSPSRRDRGEGHHHTITPSFLRMSFRQRRTSCSPRLLVVSSSRRCLVVVSSSSRRRLVVVSSPPLLVSSTPTLLRLVVSSSSRRLVVVSSSSRRRLVVSSSSPRRLLLVLSSSSRPLVVSSSRRLLLLSFPLLSSRETCRRVTNDSAGNASTCARDARPLACDCSPRGRARVAVRAAHGARAGERLDPPAIQCSARSSNATERRLSKQSDGIWNITSRPTYLPAAAPVTRRVTSGAAGRNHCA